MAVAGFALPYGGPGYPLELWLASAMLAVTFPAMVVFASDFRFWPLSKDVQGTNDFVQEAA